MQRSSLSLFFPCVPVPFARSLSERRRRRPGVERNSVSVGELKGWNVEILQDFCLEKWKEGMKLEQGIGLGIREIFSRFKSLEN